MRLKALPKQYIHPLEERIDEAKVLPQASIAVNDMSKCNDAEVAKSICDATENWGYFQVVRAVSLWEEEVLKGAFTF